MNAAVLKQWCKISLTGILSVILVACSTVDSTANSQIPEDARLTSATIIARHDLTTIPAPGSSSVSPTAGVGAGAIGGDGIGSGVGFGLGLSFDLSSLFERHPDTPVRVYRYSVQMKDGSTREVDSVLDLQTGNCVNVIDSSQAGYPQLTAASDC